MSDGAAIAIFVSSFLVMILVIVATALAGARYGSHHYAKAGCHAYADRTGRETRFVDYTFWNWGCLTRAADGKWISIEQLRDFAEDS